MPGSTTARLRCSSFFRSYAVRWRGSSGLRRTYAACQHSCRSGQKHFFSLNECSFSQNECSGSLQTNFYRTFGRFVSALLLINRLLVLRENPEHKIFFFVKEEERKGKRKGRLIKEEKSMRIRGKQKKTEREFFSCSLHLMILKLFFS